MTYNGPQEGAYLVYFVTGGEEILSATYGWYKGEWREARDQAFERAAQIEKGGEFGVRVYHEVIHLMHEVKEPGPRTKDQLDPNLLRNLEAVAQSAERSALHFDDMRVMPAAGVADILYEALAEIQHYRGIEE